MRRLIAEVRIPNWQVMWEVAEGLPLSVFRGQANAHWSLSTSLERAAMLGHFPPGLLPGRERWVLSQFQRRAHQLLANNPPPTEALDWLALIQHYGGPTRLLDFTHSFWAGAFFAVESATQESAIWAVNQDVIEKAAAIRWGYNRSGSDPLDVLKQHRIIVAEAIRKPDDQAPFVLNVEPFQLNSRMATQQGLFLFPLDINSSFERNLIETMAATDATATENHVVELQGGTDLPDAPILKLLLPERLHGEILYNLNRMNINAASLFGGLEGFARSLHVFLRVPSALLWDHVDERDGSHDA